jgi:hypothetical protein
MEEGPYFGCPLSFIPGTHGFMGSVNVYNNINFNIEIHPSSVCDVVLNGVSYCSCVVDQYGENCKCVDVYGSMLVRQALHAVLFWFSEDNVKYGLVPYNVKFLCGGVEKEFFFDPRMHFQHQFTCYSLAGVVLFCWNDMCLFENDSECEEEKLFKESESGSDDGVTEQIKNLSM